MNANDVIVVAAESVLPVGLLTLYIVMLPWIAKHLDFDAVRPSDALSKTPPDNLLGLIVIAVTANLFFFFPFVIRDPEQIRHSNIYFYAMGLASAISLAVSSFAALSKDKGLVVASTVVFVLYNQTSMATRTARAIDNGTRYQYISETSLSPDGKTPQVRRLRYLGKAGDQYFFIPEKTKDSTQDSIIIRRSSDIKELALYSQR